MNDNIMIRRMERVLSAALIVVVLLAVGMLGPTWMSLLVGLALVNALWRRAGEPRDEREEHLLRLKGRFVDMTVRAALIGLLVLEYVVSGKADARLLTLAGVMLAAEVLAGFVSGLRKDTLEGERPVALLFSVGCLSIVIGALGLYRYLWSS